MKFLISAFFGLFAVASSMKCESGSVTDSRNICIRPKYIEGCYSYATQQTCATCNYNYKLQENTGLCSFDSSSSQPCCLQPSGKTCKQCNRGMSLVDGSCIQTESFGCIQKTTRGQCINCASDFILSQGKCVKGVRNCIKYADSDKAICELCQHSYSLAANICLKNKILGCKVQQNKVCVQCFQPFKQFDGQCQIKRCKDYNDFGCESCDCGYFITKKMTCEKVQEGCVRYQKGICTDCFPPFALQGISCSIDGCKSLQGNKCTKCQEGYKLQKDICQLPNCLKGRNGKCEICKEGFNYNNGQCLASSNKSVFNS